MFSKLLFAIFLIGSGTFASAQAAYSFSCKIDGQPFSASGTSAMDNTAFKTAPDIINTVLVSMDPKYKGTVPPQLALYFSPNGTTTIKGNGGKYTAKYTLASQLDNDFVAQLFTVTITSLTPSRVAGSFSGKLANNKDKTITITDGKFDLPASKYSQPLK